MLGLLAPLFLSSVGPRGPTDKKEGAETAGTQLMSAQQEHMADSQLGTGWSHLSSPRPVFHAFLLVTGREEEMTDHQPHE